jgi:hypothetical protein
MKDPGYSLRKAYFSKLNGYITLNSNDVKVYDNVPNYAEYPYVQIANISTSDESTKDNFNTNCVVTIQVYTGTNGYSYSKKDADDISNQVLQLLISKTSKPDASPDFSIITAQLESSTYLETQYDGFFEVRKIIRIRNIIEQL